jgi:hypothetical protein
MYRVPAMSEYSKWRHKPFPWLGPSWKGLCWQLERYSADTLYIKAPTSNFRPEENTLSTRYDRYSSDFSVCAKWCTGTRYAVLSFWENWVNWVSSFLSCWLQWWYRAFIVTPCLLEPQYRVRYEYDESSRRGWRFNIRNILTPVD